jgi:osmotically-inducible protein OsmY
MRPQQLCVLVLAVILTGALPGCAVYRKCGFAGCAGDSKITADVRARFTQHPALEPPNLIHVQTLDRVVYLSGQVDTELQRATAESVARQAADVKQVVNSINLGYEGR